MEGIHERRDRRATGFRRHQQGVYVDGNRTVRADDKAQVSFDRYDGHVLGRFVAGSEAPVSVQNPAQAREREQADA